MNRRHFATALAATLVVAPAMADHHKSGEHADKSHAQQSSPDFDASLAEALAFSNQAEIAVSELAKDRVQTPQLRDFAQMMVQEHTKVLNRLEEFNPDITDIRNHSVDGKQNDAAASAKGNAQKELNDDERRGRQVQQQNSQSQQNRYERFREEGTSKAAGERGEGGDQGGKDKAALYDGQQDAEQAARRQAESANRMEQIWTDAAARCLNKTIADMKPQQGLDFDWAYVSQQWLAHNQMLSELEAMQGQGSDRFNKIVEDGIAATKKHREKLDSLMKILERREG